MTPTERPVPEARARTIRCPQCKAPALWSRDNRFRPFCSERCKLSDLGAWATEQYRVAGPAGEDVPGLDSEPS
jgi:endogenous inhibitor of DNA gyrase (YacG/DUF329 family)